MLFVDKITGAWNKSGEQSTANGCLKGIEVKDSLEAGQWE
jgi:hypothetical protein